MSCCICYEKNYVTKTSCNHHICINCLMELKNIICPLCRKDLYNELPRNLQRYLDAKNVSHSNRELYIRLDDPYEFPPLPRR